MSIRNIATLTIIIMLSSIASTPTLAQTSFSGRPGNDSSLAKDLLKPMYKGAYGGRQMLQLRSIRAKHRKGIEAMVFGEYTKAERAFKDVLIFKPKDASTNYLLGLTKIALGQPQEAERYLKKTVKYRSDFAYGHIMLGTTYATTGKTKKAKRQLSWLEKKFKDCAGSCPQALDLEQGKTLLANKLANTKS